MLKDCSYVNKLYPPWSAVLYVIPAYALPYSEFVNMFAQMCYVLTLF